MTVKLAGGIDMGALGRRIRAERGRRRLSLEDLAARAGVSRSMLSEVERGSKVPTVLVLDRIATGLDSSIARLLGEERSARVILLKKRDQDVAVDASGWERRILSPVLPGVEFELMRTVIPGGVDAGEFSPHAAGSREYLAMERGRLRLTIDGTGYTLGAGDSIYYAGDSVHAFANPGEEPCVYYLAMEVAGTSARTHRRRLLRARSSKEARTAPFEHPPEADGAGKAGARTRSTGPLPAGPLASRSRRQAPRRRR